MALSRLRALWRASVILGGSAAALALLTRPSISVVRSLGSAPPPSAALEAPSAPAATSGRTLASTAAAGSAARVVPLGMLPRVQIAPLASAATPPSKANDADVDDDVDDDERIPEDRDHGQQLDEADGDARRASPRPLTARLVRAAVARRDSADRSNFASGPLEPAHSVGRYRASAAVRAIQGLRETMEDEHLVHSLEGPLALFGVFDGHAGTLASIFSARRMASLLESDADYVSGPSSLVPVLSRAFHRLDEEFLQLARARRMQDGTTAVVAAVDLNEGVVYVANTGDSRAVLVHGGKVTALSVDHKPELPHEYERIRDAGGQVGRGTYRGVPYGPYRVFPGGLAMSRAIGDLSFKEPRRLVIPDPDVSVTRLEGVTEEQPAYLIVACDGLWDVLSNEAAASIVEQTKTPDTAVSALVSRAWQLETTDNVSVIVVRIVPNEPVAVASATGAPGGSA